MFDPLREHYAMLSAAMALRARAEAEPIALQTLLSEAPPGYWYDFQPEQVLALAVAEGLVWVDLYDFMVRPL